jgi:predicted transcriptional regulator
MYVDPDEQSKGKPFMPTTFELEKKYKKSDFLIQVILNLEATWIPDMVIKKKLVDKQINIPQREFIIDKEAILVNKWNLPDNEYNVMAFDRHNKLIFLKSGEMTPEDIKNISNKIDISIKEK